MVKHRLYKFAIIITVLLCMAVFINSSIQNNVIKASADENKKVFKWTKRAVDEGVTVDAAYLWPDEADASFTAIYRDGKLISDEKMVTITPGSVYHFRGSSNNSVLYTQVYVGSTSNLDILSGEAGTWYRLLPSSIRNRFEDDGWTWETGQEYAGRAHLDYENKCIIINKYDYTSVLYGMGLYLDSKYNYIDDEVFAQEGDDFKNAFGDTDNLFASSLEYYYTMGGKLSSICPNIYAMVTDSISKLVNGTEQVRNNVVTSDTSSEPELMADLLGYVNNHREQSGLPHVTWDNDNDYNIITRVNEVSILYSQTRPDGTDAFSAYTDDVMCEMRITDAGTVDEIFNCAASYFLMDELTSFNCAVYGNIAVLIFVW